MIHTLVLSLDHVQETCEEGMKVASLVQKCNSRADWVVQGALYSSTSTRRMYQNPQGLSGKRRHVFKDQM